MKLVRLYHALTSRPTCSKVHVHKVIKDNGHLAVAEGVQHGLPPEVLVAGVLGVDGHRRVPQHGLQTGGGHDHLLIWGRTGLLSLPFPDRNIMCHRQQR